MEILLYIVIIILGYLIGSIPFGLIAGRLKGIDLTKTGSGNTGTTNVLRTLGVGAGVTVFICDFLKGVIPVFIASQISQQHLFIILCAVAAILGHMYSPFMNFKGGKGVATGLGVVFMIAPYLFITSFILGLSIIAISGYVSVASILCSIFLSILMFTSGKPLPYSFAVLIITLFIIYKHIPNIKRLASGTENKLNWRRS